MGIAWQVTTAARAGAVAAWIASGNPVLGAAVPAAAQAIVAASSLGYRLFGLGGFGLARSIRREVRDLQTFESISLVLFSPIARSTDLVSDRGRRGRDHQTARLYR